jgi:hypothetical protein
MNKPKLYKVVGTLAGFAVEDAFNPNAPWSRYPQDSQLLFMGFVRQKGTKALGVLFLTEDGLLRISYAYEPEEKILDSWKPDLQEIEL